MKYILDTMVLSELRRPRRSPALVDWLGAAVPSELYVSVVSLGEIERGIAKQERTDPGHAAALVMWLEGLVTEYSDRVLSVDVPVARRWGRLSASLGHDGADLVIAATALVHGMTVATRNTRHFRATGASVVNPFESVGHAGR